MKGDFFVNLKNLLSKFRISMIEGDDLLVLVHARKKF